VLAQLGNRVQHALRAFTPRDQKAVKATATTMRQKPGLDIETAITELAVGEALVSFLDAKGRPSITERVYVLPPGSQIGPITPQQRQALMASSLVAGVYEKVVDRESAYEKLKGRAEQMAAQAPANGKGAATAPQEEGGLLGGLNDVLFGSTGPRGGRRDGLAQTMAKSAVRTMGTTLGREILRGVMGSIFGGRKR
jgi:DNA helicase HerA-like ATPase